MPEIPEKLRAAPKERGWGTSANREALGLSHCLLTTVVRHCCSCWKITLSPKIRVSANGTNLFPAIYAFDWRWCPPSVFLPPADLLVSSLLPKASQNFNLLTKCFTLWMIYWQEWLVIPLQKNLSWILLYKLLQSHRLNGLALISEWMYSAEVGVSGWSYNWNKWVLKTLSRWALNTCHFQGEDFVFIIFLSK